MKRTYGRIIKANAYFFPKNSIVTVIKKKSGVQYTYMNIIKTLSAVDTMVV